MVGGGRVESDLDQLHLGDDRDTQGRDVRASRRVPERAGRDHPPALRSRERLSVDAADVPLQRLVHALGGDRDRCDARVPACGACRRDLAALRRGARDAPRRRPDGADADRRSTRGAPARPRTGGDRGRCPSRSHGDHAHARTGCPDRARLRDDRGVRPVHAQRVAGRVGPRCRRRTRRDARPARASR